MFNVGKGLVNPQVKKTTLENIGSASSAGAGAVREITNVGQGVIVESDGVAFRGAERHFNGFSVSVSGDLLLNGKYCRELGVNAYSLITDITNNSKPTNYKTILDECAAMGVRVVRVSLTTYSSASMLSQVLGGSLPKKNFTWSDLSASYRAAVQTVFDYAASLGIYLMPSVVWQPDAFSGLYSETTTTMYTVANSKSRVFARAFTKAFVAAYKDHKAMGIYSLGNEFKLANGTWYTDAQVNPFLSDLARVIKVIDPQKAVCSSNLDAVYDGNLTRPVFQTVMSTIVANNPDPLDTVDIHAYADRAWLSPDPVNVLNSTALDAYCYAEEWMATLVKLGKAAKKPFILSEIGILGRNDAVSMTQGQEYFGQTDKLVKMLDRVFASGVQLALLWNIGDNTSGVLQTLWDFSQANGTRGSTYQPIIKQYVQKFRTSQTKELGQKYFDPAAKGHGKPQGAATFTGSNSVNIQYPAATPELLGGSVGTILLFANVAAANADYARLISACDSAGNTRGFQVLMNTGGLEPYITFMGAGVNGAGKTPALVAGTPAMRGWTWNSTALQIYVDGFWFDKKTLTTAPIARTSGDPFVLGTSYSGASGFAGWLGHVLYCGTRELTPREIADFYNYLIVPTDAVLFDLCYDGTTVGAATLTPSSISGSVTFGATSLAY